MTKAIKLNCFQMLLIDSEKRSLVVEDFVWREKSLLPQCYIIIFNPYTQSSLHEKKSVLPSLL